MLANRLCVATNNGPAERASRAKFFVIRQRLTKNRHHAAAYLGGRPTRQCSRFFRCRKQRNQQRTNHGGESVICNFVLLSHVDCMSLQVVDDLFRHADRCPVSFDGERHACQLRH